MDEETFQTQWLEGEFTSFDGLRLFYRYKQPAAASNNALMILHRGHEHSARAIPFIDKLALNDCWGFSFDLRGHGRSPGERGWAASFETWVKDLNSFANHIWGAHGIQSKDTLLIANSVSSVMAVSWVINYGPKLKGCILMAPAFSIKLYIPFALSALRLMRKFSDKLFVTSYVRSNMLTRDKVSAQGYDNDPLITKKIGVNVLVSLFDTAKNCLHRAKDFETPVLLFTAEKDFIVNNKYHTAFINQVSSKNKKHILLKDFRHAIIHEQEQEKILKPCKSFIQDLFREEIKNLPAIIPKPRPHTVKEYQELLYGGSRFKRLYFLLLRHLLSTLGRCSDGISLGLEYGFDSGRMMDYTYKNQSSGRYFIGRVIDRIFLNAVGWKGIRTRKINLKSTLIGLAHLLHERKQKPVILDIASGPGRYLFETKQELPFPVSLYLHDIDTNSISKAREIALTIV